MSDSYGGAGMAPLRIDEVKVGGEMGRRLDLVVQKNFLALDLEKIFIAPFRRENPPGEKDSAFKRFVGLGWGTDAAVLLAKQTQDPQVIARKKYLVEETIKTQEADGYIGIFTPLPEGRHLFCEYGFHEAAYIILGLSSDFLHFQEPLSLEAARKLADYLIANWPHRPMDFSFTTLGAAEGFLTLYEATGEPRYLQFATEEKMGKRAGIEPATLRDWEQDIFPRGWRDWKEWEGLAEPIKANFSICHMVRVPERCISQLRLNRLECAKGASGRPNEKLTRMSRKMYSMLIRRERPGMVITGGAGVTEGWQDTQEGTGDLGETCATVYLMWLYEELMRLDGDLRYGDVMERAVYNALFGAQDPEGRRIRYFTPFSGKRKYFAYDHYCCPNNFRRGMGRLPGSIYYQLLLCEVARSPLRYEARVGRGLAVNLYASSTATVALEDDLAVQIRQETDYPTSGLVSIRLELPREAEFPLRLRIPRWCERYEVKVNGAPAEAVSAPGGIELNRVWKSGDQITLEMSLPWRLVRGRELQEGRAALLRGPVIYCLSREKNELPEDMSLRDITIDPASLGNPASDESLRPDGLACRMKAWSPGRDLSAAPDLDLLLTEFPDPTGEEIYFKVPEGAVTADDELIEA